MRAGRGPCCVPESPFGTLSLSKPLEPCPRQPSKEDELSALQLKNLHEGIIMRNTHYSLSTHILWQFTLLNSNPAISRPLLIKPVRQLTCAKLGMGSGDWRMHPHKSFYTLVYIHVYRSHLTPKVDMCECVCVYIYIHTYIHTFVGRRRVNSLS